MRGKNLRTAGALAVMLLGGAWSAASLAGGNGQGGCTISTHDKTCKNTLTTQTAPTLTVTEAVPVPGPTTTITLTITLPQTIVQTVPSSIVTVTTPATTVVKGKPTCAHGDWDINAPRCKPKLIQACKGQYRKEILRWCLRYEAPKKKPSVKGRESNQPVVRGGGVTGSCHTDPRACRRW